VTADLRSQSLTKEHAAKGLRGAALDNQIRKNRIRWLKNYLTEAGTRRAKELGWPNTYTLHEESGRVADRKVWQGASYRGRASGDCRNLRGEAVPGVE